jgi:predicted CoA-binding protein
MAFANPPDDELRKLLLATKTIAVVGCSPDATRTSHQIAASMQARGYRILPVHPAGGVILGETAYKDLASIPADIAVDLVDVFRRSEDTPPIAREAVARRAKALWLQAGISSDEAADIARRAGLTVVMNACIAVYHSLLLGKSA